jgi:PAS domain S-box-containing protein
MRNKTIFFLGAAVALGFWLAEGMLHFYIFDKWGFFEVLFPSDSHELWMRSLTTCAIVGFGVYAQLIVNRLHESRTRYQSLFENAPDAVFLADCESGIILDANPAAEQLLLRPHDEIVGLHQAQLHPQPMEEDSRKLFSEYIDQIKHDKRPFPIEHVALRSDGLEVPVEIAAKIVHIGGKPILQGIFRDITERKKARNELENSNKRFRAVVDSLDALVYVSDMDTHEILFANKYGRDIWGDIVGKTCWKMLQSSQSGPCEFCTNDRLIDSDGKPTGVYKWEFQNTVDKQWYECHDQAIQWMDKRLVRMEIATNITEHKRAEMEKDALRKNLESLWGLAQLAEQDLNTLCDYVLKEIAERTASLYVSYGFLSEDESEEIVYSWSPDVMEDCKMKDKPRIFPVENAGLWANVIRNRAPMIINDYDKAHPGKKGLPEGHVLLKRLMVVPVFSQGRTTALAIVANKEAEYQEEDIQQLSAFLTSAQTIIDRKKTEEALQKHKDDLQIILDSVPAGIWYKDKENRLLRVNKAGAESIGMKVEDIEGRAVCELFPKEADHYYKDDLEVIKSGKPKWGIIERLQVPGGEYKWVHTDKVPYRDEQGNTAGIIAFVQDITERKQAEEALRESEHRYRTLVEANPYGIQEINTSGIITYTNPAYQKMLDYTEQELLGKSILDLLEPESRRDELRDYLSILVKEQPQPTIYYQKNRTKNGRIIDMVVDWNYNRDNEGRVVGFTSVITDITERKKTEEEKFKLLSAIETAKEATHLTSPDAIIEYTNSAMDELFGYKKGELIGKHVSILNDDSASEETVSQVMSSLEENGWWEGEVRNKRKDGTEFLSYARVSAYKDESGKTLNFVSTQHDITESKQTEKKLEAERNRLYSLLDGLPVFVYLQAPDYSVRFANRHFREQFGDLEGKLCYEVLWGTKEPCKPCPTFKVFETNEPQVWEWSQSPDGRIYEIWDYPFADVDGSPLVLELGVDITERKKAEAALAESEQRFRKFFENEPEYCYIISPQGTILEANSAALNVLGYAKEELVGKPLSTIYAPESHKRMRQLLTQWRKTGEVRNEEMVIITKNDDRRTVLLSAAQMLDEDRKTLQSISIQRDITERKQAEEILRRQSDLLNSIRRAQSLYITQGDAKPVFDVLLGALVSMTESEYGFLDEVLQDENGQLYKKSLALSDISWDEKSRKLYEELKNSNLEFRNLNNLAGVPALTGELLISNDPGHDSRSGGVPEGHPRIRSFMGIPMFFGGELVGVAGVANREGGYSEKMASFLETFISTCAGIIQAVRDDRQRQQITRALQEGEEKYRRVVEDQTEFVVRWQPDGVRTFANKAYCRYFGLSQDEVIGTSFSPLISEQDREKVQKRINSLTPDNPVSSEEHRVILPDGTIGWNHWTDRAIFDNEDKLVEYQSVGHDITERKEAEERLLEYQAKLKSLASELSLAEERQRRHIATDLHDQVSQSLALSMINLQALRKSARETDIQPLDKVCKTIKHMLGDIRNLTFDLSSPTLYKFGLEAAIVELLNDQLRDRHGIACEFSDDQKPKPLDNDIRVLLFQSVRELLINIIKHAKAEKVLVAIQRDGGNIQITVNDDGVGFDVDQAESSMLRTGGFGLFNIRERLDYIGGSFEMCSQLGSGSRFTLIAPLKTNTDLAKEKGE